MGSLVKKGVVQQILMTTRVCLDICVTDDECTRLATLSRDQSEEHGEDIQKDPVKLCRKTKFK